MKAANFNFGDYCHRIGFHGEARADLATLQALMRAQLFTVPFENLDVQAGKWISLEPEAIVEKIIHQRRGGYCYEVNGLFAMALTALGIPYYFVGARPMFYPTRRPRTHMVIIAQLAGQDYLCDLGFGSYGIRAPMALQDINVDVQQDMDCFRLACLDGNNYCVQAWVDGDWVNQFGFDLYPHEMLDFIPANYFNCTHPETIFVKQLLVVKHHPEGRKILSANRLKVVAHGQSHSRELLPEEIPAVLRDEFGLVVQE